MGSERSNAKVAAKLGKSVQLMNRWSRTWNWVQRARDYENDLKREEFEEAQKQIKKMQQRQLQTSVLVQRKAVEALDQLDIQRLTPKDILNFISIGAELERQLRAESAGEAAKESGQSDSTSLAEAINAAYLRRQEQEANDD